MHVDGVPLIPKKGLPLRPGRRIHVRFWKRQRPQHLSIHGYPRVDSEGGLTGQPRRLSYRLRRKVWAGGGHIWIATLRAPRFDHVYLDLFVRWRDEENCGGAQSMAMVWHLRNGADSS
jgi:hypothetical protein